MRLRTLGKTGIKVGELSLGGLFTSSLAGGVDETKKILRRAVELGVNLIDTAPAYADSEATLGPALAEIDAPLVISTKLGGRPQPFDPQDPAGLTSSVEESLRLLGRETIDLLFIHEPDRPGQYAWWTSYDPLDGPVLGVIDRLKQQGKIRFSGLGGTTVSEMTGIVRSGLFDVLLTAFNYNLLYREAARDLIPAATERHMGILLGSTMGQGGIARRFDDEVRRGAPWLSGARQEQLLALYALCDESGMALPEMCLRFAVGTELIHTIPIGCKNVAQLEESVAAVEKGPLPEDVRQRLDEIAALVPFRPFEEPMILPFGKAYYGPGPANVGAGVKVGRL
ncbi:MAG TPA: aldo/keto reductase [Pirellulaceae bacterium]|jgi:aryl-alcohol dehydrogenase-like predicted oxidoreductase|nr:aldo/keto reductase [Pirellulaceae bacterium]